ncbi:hypothetical protein B4Q13_20210, partial [Lacticaseibacillus rhamnosus]
MPETLSFAEGATLGVSYATARPALGDRGRLKRGETLLVLGAGGLGAPLLQYLAAAGIGTVGVVDDDTVDLSNLQRQVIHRTNDIGAPKVLSAQRALSDINPEV